VQIVTAGKVGVPEKIVEFEEGLGIACQISFVFLVSKLIIINTPFLARDDTTF
jgi:hypothetical protein